MGSACALSARDQSHARAALTRLHRKVSLLALQPSIPVVAAVQAAQRIRVITYARSWMADEKDPLIPKEPAAGAAPEAIGATPTRPPDTAAAHPPGTAAGSTPPVPTPPMTPATAPGGVQAAPAPRSNAATGAAPPAAKPAEPESVSRRGFLKWTTVGWVAFSAACTS